MPTLAEEDWSWPMYKDGADEAEELNRQLEPIAAEIAAGIAKPKPKKVKKKVKPKTQVFHIPVTKQGQEVPVDLI